MGRCGDMTLRYAIYAAPATDDPLWQAAAVWLGRDASSGRIAAPPVIEGLDAADVSAYLADPARYGFHATLKAPFQLAKHRSESELIDLFDSFARTSAPILIPELIIRRLGSFFAFVPNEPVAALDRWAGAVVETFEPLRAPLADADIARRRKANLTLAEEAHLLRWGYPYVFDTFRFHMSLTGRVPREHAEAVDAALRTHFAAFDGRPWRLDRIAVFVEPEPGAPFSILRSRPLG